MTVLSLETQTVLTTEIQTTFLCATAMTKR